MMISEAVRRAVHLRRYGLACGGYVSLPHEALFFAREGLAHNNWGPAAWKWSLADAMLWYECSEK